MQESREHIKARMLKNAARIWGYPETESESNFDPIVSMLLSACSIELEKISGEVHASRARVLERLVQLLSPDALTGAMPSHGIVTATAVESNHTITEDEQYYLSRKSPVGDKEDAETKDIYFSPTASFQLNKATVRYMGIGKNLYRLHSGITKELVAQAEEDKSLPDSSLWLGVDEPSVSLKNTLFYFDLRNEANKQLFYHQLPKATWFWNEFPMKTSPGYGPRTISGEQLDLNSVLNNETDITEKIKKQVNSFYKTSFITLNDTEDLSISDGNELLSGMIADTFEAKALKLFQKQSLRWICIDFPKTISNTILEDVVCVMNCFPVFNRRFHDLTYRLREIVNIIPLQTEDLFIDLQDVSSDEGEKLNTRDFRDNDNSEPGLVLRSGGVGRFDERDASATVDYVVQLLRDESAAFSSLGNDFMNNEMKQLQQIINKLEQRLFSKQLTREKIPYLIIRNNKNNSFQNVFIRYWSCVGSEGNNIKAGNILKLYKGSGVENNQAILISTTRGGRNKLSTTETVLAYKSALLSKDRLVSQEDIKAFCYYQLGERVRKIDIKKGFMIHPDQEQGFMKTLDVVISIERKEYEDMVDNGEISFWIDHLKLLLHEKSLGLFPYRLFIQQAE
jgi:hypothetical protein